MLDLLDFIIISLIIIFSITYIAYVKYAYMLTSSAYLRKSQRGTLNEKAETINEKGKIRKVQKTDKKSTGKPVYRPTGEQKSELIEDGKKSGFSVLVVEDGITITLDLIILTCLSN